MLYPLIFAMSSNEWDWFGGNPYFLLNLFL